MAFPGRRLWKQNWEGKFLHFPGDGPVAVGAKSQARSWALAGLPQTSLMGQRARAEGVKDTV